MVYSNKTIISFILIKELCGLFSQKNHIRFVYIKLYNLILKHAIAMLTGIERIVYHIIKFLWICLSFLIIKFPIG